MIVGQYADGAGNEHGFSYSNGVWTNFDEPSAVHGTFAYGINDFG